VIDEDTDLAVLLETLQGVLPLAMAEIDKYIEDEDLRDHLLAGGGTGSTRYESLRRLSVLVSVYGPQEKLDSVLAELRAQGITDLLREDIEAHISKLVLSRT
jgi:Ethanolamine utilization protein EutJ (predicted chaperonin)